MRDANSRHLDLSEDARKAMEIRQAHVEDAAAILALQKLAYQNTALLYGTPAISPMTQTLDSLAADFERTLFLKMTTPQQQLIGSVRGFQVGSTVFVERLIVAPEYRQRGIGTALVQRIEAQFADAQRFELYAGERNEIAVRLCQKVGYRELKRERMSHQRIFIFMEKLVGAFAYPPAEPARARSLS